MAFEITSDTVVKILVRRGLEIERQETLLSEGELGLSVDSRRLLLVMGTLLVAPLLVILTLALLTTLQT